MKNQYTKEQLEEIKELVCISYHKGYEICGYMEVHSQPPVPIGLCELMNQKGLIITDDEIFKNY